MTAPSRKRKQDASGEEASSLPTRRVSQACDICRLAKIRCGGEKPQCMRCIESELHCSYDSPSRRRGPEKGINYRINQRMSNLEKLLEGTLDEVRQNFARVNNRPAVTDETGLTIQSDERGGAGPQQLGASTHVKHQTRGLGQGSPASSQSPLPACRRSESARREESPDGNPSPPAGPVQNHYSIATTAQSDESVVSTTIPLPTLGTYYGSPHADKLGTSKDVVSLHFNGASPTIKVSEKRPMPDTDVVLHLIDKFFVYVHGQQYTFLHRESLVNDFLRGTVAPELIYALCAVAARFSDRASFRGSLLYRAGEQFAAEALDIIVCNLNGPTISTVQALLLLSLHAAGCMKGTQAWVLGGMAFRICHLLCLHKDAGGTECADWHEAEMRRRTFWYAFVVDRFSSAGSGVPWSMPSDGPLPRLQISEKLFLQERPAAAPRFADDKTQLDENLGCVAYLARLAELWGLVAFYVSDPDRQIEPDKPSSRYRWLKTRLKNWYSRLPDRLHYTARTLCSAITHGEGGALAFTHMLYHASCSFVEQAVFAHFSNLPGAFLHEAAISMDKHAHECVKIYTKTTATYSTYLYTPLTAYMLLLSGIILARQSFVKDSETAASARQRYGDAENGIKRLMPYWAPAERYLTTLNAYYNSLKSLTEKRQDRQNHHLGSNGEIINAEGNAHVDTVSMASKSAIDHPVNIASQNLSPIEATSPQPGTATNRPYPTFAPSPPAVTFDDATFGRMPQMDMWTLSNDPMPTSAGILPWFTGETDVSWNSNGAFPPFPYT